jgi:hypothetical protein
LAAIKSGNYKDPKIFNPKGLTPQELTQEFYGACHFSFDQVMVLPGQDGLNNVRFQPYTELHNKERLLM